LTAARSGVLVGRHGIGTFGAEELGALGYWLVLYANAALQGAVAGMQCALAVLRDTRRLDEAPSLVTSTFALSFRKFPVIVSIS
jgi:hypothetical protein